MKPYDDKKIDRRISKTKASIRNSLVKLMCEKEIEDITVKELAEEADINRKTFYTHYTKLDDILEEIQNELIQKLQLLIKQYDFPESKFDVYSLFKGLNKIINEDFDFYQRLISANSYSFLLNKVKDMFKASVMEKMEGKLEIKKDILQLYTEYVASGIMAMYIEWFKSEKKLPLEELADAAGIIVFEGLNAIIKSKGVSTL